MAGTFSIRARWKRSAGFINQLDGDSALKEREPSGRIIDVSAALLFRRRKLLITQRLAGGHLAGLWEFPGGKVEPGETFERCLARELREELAIEAAVHELVEEILHSYPEKTVRLRFFRCSLLSGEPQALQCQALAWVSQADLDLYSFPPADAQLLIRLKNLREVWD
jgi:mutator protein MutT